MEFAELFIHAMTTVTSTTTKNSTSGSKFNPEIFLTRILEYSFDRNDDHNISMMEVNQHIHQLIVKTIPTPLAYTSPNEHFWLAMQKYFSNLQQQYAALLRIQVLKRWNETKLNTLQAHATQDRIVILKPFQSIDFLCTIPTFSKSKYPYDYVSLMKFPSYIRSIDELYTSAYIHDILSNMTELPSSRAFLSLSVNALYYGKDKKNWNIQNVQKQILNLHTLINSTTTSSFAARKDSTSASKTSPSDVYNYEELQALLYLMENSNLNTLTSFQYSPVFASPGVYTFRAVLPAVPQQSDEKEDERAIKYDKGALDDVLNNELSKSAYFKESSSNEHFLPNFFAPFVRETVEEFLAIPPPIKLNASTRSISNTSVVTVNAAMNQEDYTVKYMQLLELLFQVEEQSVMLQRDANEYNHIQYLRNQLAKWKMNYGIQLRKKMLLDQVTSTLNRLDKNKENYFEDDTKDVIPVKLPILVPAKTQVDFVQNYSHLLMPLPKLLTEIHALLLSFLHPSAEALDLQHPQLQDALMQVIMLLEVIKHSTSMTADDVAQVSELSNDIRRLIKFFVDSKTTVRSQEIPTVVIVEQIHVLLDQAMEKAIQEQMVAMIDAKALTSILHEYIQDLYVKEILPVIVDKPSTVATRELFIAVYKYLWSGIMKEDTSEAKELFGSPNSPNTAPAATTNNNTKENNRFSMRLSTGAPNNDTVQSVAVSNALTKICEFIQSKRTAKVSTAKTLDLLQSIQTSLKALLEGTWEEYYLHIHTTAVKKDTSKSVDCCLPIFGGSQKKSDFKKKLASQKKLYHTVVEVQELSWKLEVNTRYYYTVQFIEENVHSSLGQTATESVNSGAINKEDAVALLWQRLHLVVELKQFVNQIWLFQLKFALHSWYRAHGSIGNNVTSNSVSSISFAQNSKSFAMDELTALLHIFSFFQRIIQFLTPKFIVKAAVVPQGMQPIPIFKTILLNAAKLTTTSTSVASSDESINQTTKKQSLRISVDHISTVLVSAIACIYLILFH